MNKSLQSRTNSIKAKKLASLHRGTAFDLIGGKLLRINSKQVCASFTLNNVSRQVYGLLHGGIYAYVAESLASLGAWMSTDEDSMLCLGVEISASHLKAVSVPGARVSAVANCKKSGRNMQIWSIDFYDKDKDLLSIARCSVFLRPKTSETKADFKSKTVKTRAAKSDK